MKRLIIAISFIIASLSTLSGQSIDEALRYSQIFYGGTARFQAMGGAFTSLGGDLSVLSLNPAGLAMFRSTDLSFTPQMYFNNSTTDFDGTTSSDYMYDLNLNQFGVALPIIKGSGNSGLVSLNFGYSKTVTNNFNGNAVIDGQLDNSSMVDYFMAGAQGYHYEDLVGAEGMLFDTWMIDTLPGDPTAYATAFSDFGFSANSTYGQDIRRVISSEGTSIENSLSLAANFDDKIYLGVTLGISSIFSIYKYEHLETDTDDNIYPFDQFQYQDYVENDGRGYSVKLGAIIRPIEALRLGFAVHSPVVYRMNYYYLESMYGSLDDWYSDDYSNEGSYSYTMTTPLRVNTGASFQLGKKGIISADYEFVDYKMARFSDPEGEYNYVQENQSIKSVFDVAHNFRLGAEFRLTSSVYLRGGYALYGSGFNKDEDNRDNSYNVISGGLGIRQSNFYFDLSYALRTNTGDYFMYQDDYLSPASITYDRNMISATIGVKL